MPRMLLRRETTCEATGFARFRVRSIRRREARCDSPSRMGHGGNQALHLEFVATMDLPVFGGSDKPDIAEVWIFHALIPPLNDDRGEDGATLRPVAVRLPGRVRWLGDFGFGKGGWFGLSWNQLPACGHLGVLAKNFV